jgi:hypothetical protein
LKIISSIKNEERKYSNEENLKDDSNINHQPEEKKSDTKKNDALEDTEILDQEHSISSKNEEVFKEV